MHLRGCSPSPDSPTQEHSHPRLQLRTTEREREGETPPEDHSEHLRFNVIELLIIHRKRIIQSFLVSKIYSPSPVWIEEIFFFPVRWDMNYYQVHNLHFQLNVQCCIQPLLYILAPSKYNHLKLALKCTCHLLPIMSTVKAFFFSFLNPIPCSVVPSH